jgi:ABC-type branched-subunit amino acid transport system substrate-binding protein
VASIGLKSQTPGLEWGARGRIERFNKTNEIPGVKIEYLEYAEDNGDPALTLTEMRRLVTSSKIFGIVGDFSSTHPGQYMVQQKVPFVGSGLDKSYCSSTAKPSTEVWGFSVNGCQVNPDPPKVSDEGRLLYKHLKETTGKDKPTMAIIGGDSESGKNAVRFLVPAQEGAGFDVVYAEGSIPTATAVSDFTPYAQALLHADGGKAPDAINCRLAIECIQLYGLLKASGYKGAFQHYLYSDLLVKAMDGSYVQTYEPPFNTSSPANDQMKKDVAAVKADAGIDIPSWSGYVAADIFITALEEIAKDGKDYITQENLQQALSTMTWEVKGLGGPIKYPESTINPTPSCYAILKDDGTQWVEVEPYSCSSKTFPVK